MGASASASSTPAVRLEVPARTKGVDPQKIEAPVDTKPKPELCLVVDVSVCVCMYITLLFICV
jgi:hypothetical protein